MAEGEPPAARVEAFPVDVRQADPGSSRSASVIDLEHLERHEPDLRVFVRSERRSDATLEVVLRLVPDPGA
ncbi:MAG TPA: hypothetical protein VME70_12225 [Mycobacteriales bacterium]|nr:hypothetical protein [Mycobacteriales bacterium]